MDNVPFFKKRGFPLPLGSTVQEGGVNFSLFSRHAEKVVLVIEITDDFSSGPIEVELDPAINKTGDIWHIFLLVDPSKILYGYKIHGISEQGRVYKPNRVLLDPYCQKLRANGWGEHKQLGTKPVCEIMEHDFDWQGDQPLKTPLSETIIYELHVKGYTGHPDSGVEAKGTYRGLIEKIDYLMELGVTAVELMPVTEFDEMDNVFFHPQTGERLKNFWGYNPISFFALKSAYAHQASDHINEFKRMVRAFHRAGIEVYLDMVYNHSGEGGYDGTTSSFRGIDNSIYYLLDGVDKHYLNFSGCGNTLNCNHPVVRDLIKYSLRYWVIEMHIDGFRFDLASILGRDQQGNVLANPPMIEIIAEDPVLRDTKIIAEAWDAAGLYQVGSFSTDERWAEWNGRYRDDIRRFFAGQQNSVNGLATRIAGSSDLYESSSRGPLSSINFLTSHDGFTLHDLVSYEEKHNLDNGEDNRDGDNHNISWNSGIEGESDDETIILLRMQRMKAMAATLLFSQGVPMITAGDEFGRSQRGNNNSWCQDNEISWVDWSLVQKNSELLRFFKGCIRLRRSHPVFMREDFFKQVDKEQQPSEITWQSTLVGTEDWSESCQHLAFLLHGEKLEEGDDDFFILLNGSRDESVQFQIPEVPQKLLGGVWRKIINSSAQPPQDLVKYSEAEKVYAFDRLEVPAQTVMVLQAIANDKEL